MSQKLAKSSRPLTNLFFLLKVNHDGATGAKNQVHSVFLLINDNIYIWNEFTIYDNTTGLKYSAFVALLI